MSKFSVANSSQPNKSCFACHFNSDFARFCAVFHSRSYHYISSLILFSYFFSFLFPLLITISLLALLTVSLTKNQESHVGFFLSTYNNILQKLKSKGNNGSEQDFSQLEELEAYNFLFGTCMHDQVEGDPEEVWEMKPEEKIVHAIESTVEEYPKASGNFSFDDNRYSNAFEHFVKGDSSDGYNRENDNFDDDVFFDIKVKKVNEDKEKWSMLSMTSKAVGIKVSTVLAKEGIDNDKKVPAKVVEKNIQKVGTYFDCFDDFVVHEPSSVKVSSRKLDTNLSVKEKVGEINSIRQSPNLESFGSVRREKEWRKTLACKLFEERHNVNACISEGMDLLWETYEAESVYVKQANANKGVINAEFIEDDMDAQFCCLQALKISTGKMNLGMRSPSLRRISKAFKGIGRLHRESKHGKKVHHST